MKRRTIACIGLFLCAPLLAQTYRTTPDGLLTTEGNYVACGLTSWAVHHYQKSDNTLLGKPGALSELAFRLDNRSHTSLTAMGRTWSSIKLVMSEQTNYATMSRFPSADGPSPKAAPTSTSTRAGASGNSTNATPAAAKAATSSHRPLNIAALRVSSS